MNLPGILRDVKLNMINKPKGHGSTLEVRNQILSFIVL